MMLFLFLGDRLALPGVGLIHYSPRPAGFKRIARRTSHVFLDRRMHRATRFGKATFFAHLRLPTLNSSG
ncbi:hypothetical protein DIE07_21845 [Burkholderia sp. Bp9002]|nr:hypothetical protein DIE07_21845 [Burkholderia sp. Bp9002]